MEGRHVGRLDDWYRRRTEDIAARRAHANWRNWTKLGSQAAGEEDLSGMEGTELLAGGAARDGVRSTERDEAPPRGRLRGAGTIGVTGQATLGPVGIVGGAGVALDANGEVVGYGTLGLGATRPGLAANGGVTLGANNGSVRDFDGWFANSGLSGGDGVAIGVEKYSGEGDDGRPIKGGAVTLGPGAGGSFFGGPTYTWTTRPLRLEDVLYRTARMLAPGLPPRREVAPFHAR